MGAARVFYRRNARWRIVCAGWSKGDAIGKGYSTRAEDGGFRRFTGGVVADFAFVRREPLNGAQPEVIRAIRCSGGALYHNPR